MDKRDDSKQDTSRSPDSRRSFLARVGGLGAALAGVAAPPLVSGLQQTDAGHEIGPGTGRERRLQAYQIRLRAAQRLLQRPLQQHPDNGDERRYENRIASNSKCLPHDDLGHVDPNAYHSLLAALDSGLPSDFEAIPLGGTVKLANPQASYTFDLEGFDSHDPHFPAAPAFSSAWEASEMGEVYWQALTRDIPFIDYATDPLIAQAAADLSAFSDFRGPKDGGVVTPGTLFRGNTPGDLTGPYISQFLWKDVPYGALTMTQRYRTTVPGDDYLTAYQDWLDRQRGVPPPSGNVFDPTPRYIRNGRDLGEWDHRDFTYQGLLNAGLILLSFGPAAFDAGNPYLASATQGAFVTFGAGHLLDLVARVANAGLRAAWYQKWLVHRRLRTEEFGARVHNHLTGAASYPINQELLDSAAVDAVFDAHGTYLLPMAYPEGSPTHSAYPSGHATIAGACVTVLKAFFLESFVIPNPVEASADGLSLVPYTGADLTVGDELNKLAANIGIGRDAAGVHWRTDIFEGMNLGEAVAIAALGDLRATLTEKFSGFSLTRFDGTTVRV